MSDTIRGAMAISPEREDRALAILCLATVAAYAVGYPVALIGHSNVGWIFVALGGPLLVAVFVLIIRRVQR